MRVQCVSFLPGVLLRGNPCACFVYVANSQRTFWVHTISMMPSLCFVALALTSADDESCTSPLSIIPLSVGGQKDYWRYRESVACEFSFEELEARIPRHYMALEGENEVGALEDAPFFAEGERGAMIGCFRAVIDDFLTLEEAAGLETLLEPFFAQQREQAAGTADTVVRLVRAQVDDARRALVDSVIARVRRSLMQHFGVADGGMEPYIVARSSRVVVDDVARAHSFAAERQLSFSRGELALSSLPAEQAQPHFDAAWLPTIAFTALLYLADEAAIAGGETLFVDSLDNNGRVNKGLLVTPRRARATIYTAGAENVHLAAGNLAGNRTILQLWLKVPLDSTSVAYGNRK